MTSNNQILEQDFNNIDATKGLVNIHNMIEFWGPKSFQAIIHNGDIIKILESTEMPLEENVSIIAGTNNVLHEYYHRGGNQVITITTTHNQDLIIIGANGDVLYNSHL